MSSTGSISSMLATHLVIMATRSQDQDLVSQVGKEQTKTIPSFGWHPWFSHQLYDDESPPASKEDHYQAVLTPPPDSTFINGLPEPVPVSQFISETRKRLLEHEKALVGEIGLDKAFRLPEPELPTNRDESLTPGGREGRMLSKQRVSMQHQQAILTAQLRLAGELGRAVSVHGVQAHGILYNTMADCWKGHEVQVMSRRQKRQVAEGAEDPDSEDEESRKVYGKPFPPRICLHSYSGSADLLTQWMHSSVPAKVFVSFSAAVNLGTEKVAAKVDDVIRAVPDDRVLVESDLHTAGRVMDGALEHMYRRVCNAKGWELEDGINRIANNFVTFIHGGQ